jgi:hypothetical protein
MHLLMVLIFPNRLIKLYNGGKERDKILWQKENKKDVSSVISNDHHMKLRRKAHYLLFLEQKLYFWQTLILFKRLRIMVINFLLLLSRKIEDGSTKSKTGFAIFISGFFGVGISVLFVLVFYWIESFTGLTVDSTKFKDFYQPFYLAAAQISGAFIGLYFTAISIIASTSYARVPTFIRGLLLKDRYSELYFRLLCTLFCCAMIQDVEPMVFGVYPARLNIGFDALLAVIAVASFVKRAQSIFHLFNYSSLLGTQKRDLVRCIERAQANSIFSIDSASQEFFSDRALRILANIETIFSLEDSSDELGLQIDDLLSSVNALSKIALYYARKKSGISTGSFWFRRIHVSTDRQAQYSDTARAALTFGMHLNNKAVPDRYWFENQIERIYFHLLDSRIKKKKEVETAIKISVIINHHVQILISSLCVDKASKVAQTYLDDTLRIIPTLADSLGIRDVTLSADLILQCVSYLDTALLNLVVIPFGLTQSITNLRAKVNRLIGSVDFEDKNSLYSYGLPWEMLNDMEGFSELIKTEKEVEGKVITQDWFIKETIHRSYVNYLRTTTEILIAFISQAFEFVYNSDKNDQLSVITNAHILLLQYESIKRVSQYLNTILEDGVILQSSEKGKFERSGEIAKEIEVSTIVKCGEILSGEQIIPELESLRDYNGELYAIIVDGVHHGLSDKSIERFQKIFPLYFDAAISERRRLNKELSTTASPNIFLRATEPLMDLMAISGLARIYTPLDELDYWQVAKLKWKAYLDSLGDNAMPFVRALIAGYALHREAFAITPPSVNRTAWTQGLQQRLHEMGYADTGSYYAMTGEENPISDPILRRLTFGTFVIDNPIDIFIACFIVDLGILNESEFSEEVRRMAAENRTFEIN